MSPCSDQYSSHTLQGAKQKPLRFVYNSFMRDGSISKAALMSLGVRLPVVFILACFGVLAAIQVAHQPLTTISIGIQHGEAVLAANDSLLPAALDSDYLVAPKPTRNTLARVRRTRQNTVPSQAVFAGAVTTGITCRLFNFSAVSDVKTFRPVLALARLWRRGPPSFVLA